MRNIGILGGLGPESTTDYYKEIISAFNTKYPDLAYPEIIIYSANINELMQFVENSAWESMTEWLLGKIKKIYSAGADFAVIASNTPHIVFNELKEQSPLPLLSIVEETSKEAQKRKLKKIGLIGTKLTMASDFYAKPFMSKNMAIVVPTEDEQKLIHHRIFSEIEVGNFEETTRNELLSIVKRMVDEEKIDSVILGCTELPLILTKDEFGIPFLNTTAIHCESIINYCINGQDP